MPGCWARTSCLRAWKTEETHAGGQAIRALEINKEEPHTPESEVMSPPVTGVTWKAISERECCGNVELSKDQKVCPSSDGRAIFRRQHFKISAARMACTCEPLTPGSSPGHSVR